MDRLKEVFSKLTKKEKLLIDNGLDLLLQENYCYIDNELKTIEELRKAISNDNYFSS